MLNPDRGLTQQRLIFALQLAVLVYGALQVVLLVLLSLDDNQRTATAVASAALATGCVVVIGLLSWFEHSRSVRPSSVLGAYLFFTIVFDVVRARTLWLMSPSNRVIAICFTASVGTKLGLFVIESIEKRRHAIDREKKLSPEETGGIFNRALFGWLNPLMRAGFGKILSVDDLYPLNEELEATRLQAKFLIEWEKGEYFNLFQNLSR